MKTQGEKIHLVCLATEGPPFDKGLPIYSECETVIRVADLDFKSIEISTPSRLINESFVWVERFRDYRQLIENEIKEKSLDRLNWNKSWASFGLMVWKPWLILRRIEQSDIEENEIVLYHDLNILKYPSYIKSLKKAPEYVPKVMGFSSVLLFFDGIADMRQDIKHELISEISNFEIDVFHPTIMAGFLAIRKNDHGIEFLKRWCMFTEIYKNINPVSLPPYDPRFIWHTPEQATLSIIAHEASKLRICHIRLVNLRGSRSIPGSFFPSASFVLRLLGRAFLSLKLRIQKCSSTLHGLMDER